MMSVGQGEIVLRGEAANKYIGMDSDGNLGTYVSDNFFLRFVYNARYLCKNCKNRKRKHALQGLPNHESTHLLSSCLGFDTLTRRPMCY